MLLPSPFQYGNERHNQEGDACEKQASREKPDDEGDDGGWKNEEKYFDQQYDYG
jgi:hypothetical protein